MRSTEVPQSMVSMECPQSVGIVEGKDSVGNTVCTQHVGKQRRHRCWGHRCAHNRRVWLSMHSHQGRRCAVGGAGCGRTAGGVGDAHTVSGSVVHAQSSGLVVQGPMAQLAVHAQSVRSAACKQSAGLAVHRVSGISSAQSWWGQWREQRWPVWQCVHNRRGQRLAQSRCGPQSSHILCHPWSEHSL